MYILEGHILESVDTTTYLGIAISSNMTWNAHINNIASKAQKLLGFFFRRNLQIKNEHTKSMTHKSLVSSNLEYYSTISPHTKKQKSKI
jgi:hypothetical protein